MVRAKRITADPLIGAEKLNTDDDRRRVRRPLLPEESSRLVATAKAGKTLEGMTGLERALAYVLAAYTGFRRRSIQNLRVCDFDFTTNTVVLPAKAAKNRKTTAATPLHPAIAAAVYKVVKGLDSTDRVLPGLTKHASADAFKADLKAANILILDSLGRVVDFHALRGTFSTWLKDTGTNLCGQPEADAPLDPRLDSQHLF